MSLGAAEKIYLCVALADFGGMVVCLGIGLHLAYTKMDLMLDHLKNCPAVMGRVFLINTGPWGRLVLLGGIMGAMAMPSIHLRIGAASAEDLKNFPADLKRKLIVLCWTNGVLIVVMLALFAVIKLGLV